MQAAGLEGLNDEQRTAVTQIGNLTKAWESQRAYLAANNLQCDIDLAMYPCNV